MKETSIPATSFFRSALLVAIALLPMGAMAFDLSSDSSRVVSDPSYLPLGAQLFGSTEYSYNQTTSNTENYQGAQLFSNKTTTTTIIQVLEYGVTDDFSLRVSGYYQLQGATNNYSSGANTVTTSYGVGDPTFAAIWRVLDQKTQPLNCDLIGAYTADLINAESASSGQFGTVARGGAMAVLGMALSHKTKGFTVYVEGSATYLDSRDVLNQTNGFTTNFDSSWQYAVYFTTQTRFTDQFSLNAGVSQTFTDSQNASFTNANGKLIDYTNQAGDPTVLTVALNYQVTLGGFVASLIYTHDFYANGGNDFSKFPKSDTTTSDKSANLFGAEVRYVFD